jgi:hypothetical protein
MTAGARRYTTCWGVLSQPDKQVMTSCQVSEKWKAGPVAAQMTVIATPATKRAWRANNIGRPLSERAKLSSHRMRLPKVTVFTHSSNSSRA